MLIIYICTISVLKVTVGACRVRGCGTMWGAFIYCITEKMTVQRCFVLVSITPVFFPSLVSAFFSSSKLLFNVKVF